MDFHRTWILNVAVSSLIGGIFIVGLIDRYYKPRDKAAERQRNVYLWKFELNSKNDIEEMLTIDKWSIRKLWVAGSMVSSTLIAITVKRLGWTAVIIGIIFLVLWTIFLSYFWYFEVMKKYDIQVIRNQDNENDTNYDDSIDMGNKETWKNMNNHEMFKSLHGMLWERQYQSDNDLVNQPVIDSSMLQSDTFNEIILNILNSNNKLNVNSISQSTDIIGNTDNTNSRSNIKDDRKDTRLPLTIITGFLGSGKTTVIKNILSNTMGIRILVIENEIGAEGIDHDLLLQQTEKEDIILLNNGCVCCTVRKDLLITFDEIFSDEELFSRLQWIIIETTGLADPAPLIQTLYMDKVCQHRLRLDSVITIVDSKHFSHHINNDLSSSLSSSSSSSSSPSSSSSSSRGGLFHSSSILPEVVSQVIYADRILLNKIDLVTKDEIDNLHHVIKRYNNQADILTCTHGNVDLDKLLNIRAFDPNKNTALLSSSNLFSIPVNNDGKIPLKAMKFGVKKNQEVLLPESIITSVSLLAKQPMDLNKINLWIVKMLETRGKDIYRLKGILDIYGYNNMFVAHGIHMIFDGQLGGKWSNEQSRQSRLVIIGKNLDETQLYEEFLSCIHTSSVE